MYEACFWKVWKWQLIVFVFGLTLGRVGSAWKAVWTAQAWADCIFAIFQKTTTKIRYCAPQSPKNTWFESPWGAYFGTVWNLFQFLFLNGARDVLLSVFGCPTKADTVGHRAPTLKNYHPGNENHAAIPIAVLTTPKKINQGHKIVPFWVTIG